LVIARRQFRKSSGRAQAADSRVVGANGRFYAQLKIENPITGLKKTRGVPLNDTDGQPVQTGAQAVAKLKRLQKQQSDNLLQLNRIALFAKRMIFSPRQLHFALKIIRIFHS
jgi:hypothetical protein